MFSEYSKLQKELSRETETFKTLLLEKQKLSEIGSGDRQLMQWKIKINAALGVKEQTLRKLVEKKKIYEEEIKKASNAKVVVTEIIYAGTIMTIEGAVHKITEDRKTIDKMIFRLDGKKEKVIML